MKPSRMAVGRAPATTCTRPAQIERTAKHNFPGKRVNGKDEGGAHPRATGAASTRETHASATNATLVGRLLLNLLVVSIWVVVFNALGFITLRPEPHLLADPTIGHLVDAAIIGTVICAAGEVGALLYVVSIAATAGLACLFLPVYWLLIGYFKLWLASVVLPGWFQYSHNLIAVVFMSSILGASRFHWRGERPDPKKTGADRPRPIDGREVQAEWREIRDDEKR